jgi:A/G-specific adenine glycosylase
MVGIAPEVSRYFLAPGAAPGGHRPAMTKRARTNRLPDAAAFGAALMGWYRREARPLPWRQAPSLYSTVVSEFMLQQTQVATVLPYFARWMEAFPGFRALAQAPQERVMRLWEGLGYYTRARNLHRLAAAVADLPTPPQTAAQWRELPGVGPYTAAAIASIALGERVACVDGNVVRILARVTGTSTRFRDGSAAAKALAPAAQELVPARDPGDHNQAMMELGATVCSRSAPRCGACPVRQFCAAAKGGNPSALPRLEPKPTERRSVNLVWCVRDGALLLHRAGSGARRLAGLYELPSASQAGVPGRAGRLLGTQARSITRYRITESLREVAGPRGRLGPGLEWVPLARIESVTLSGPHRRWVSRTLSAPPTGR